jgi:hypothetical protein
LIAMAGARDNALRPNFIDIVGAAIFTEAV